MTKAVSTLRKDAAACAGFLRLGLNQRTWKGSQGNWAGAGVGSSIDFQDHRPYIPGDDPRYIDWAAYARSGQTIMKLYREEVSPCIDLLIDTSESMAVSEAKEEQVLRLLYFCVESALSLGASLRVFRVSPEDAFEIPLEKIVHGAEPPFAFQQTPAAPDFTRVPLRTGSLRIVVSDLLFPSTPDNMLSRLVEGKGVGVLLVPYTQLEVHPDWEDNMELLDCEGGMSRRQRVTTSLMKQYRQAYHQHMDSWREASLKYQMQMIRVSCDSPLPEALREEALPMGVVESWG